VRKHKPAEYLQKYRSTKITEKAHNQLLPKYFPLSFFFACSLIFAEFVSIIQLTENLFLSNFLLWLRNKNNFSSENLSWVFELELKPKIYKCYS